MKEIICSTDLATKYERGSKVVVYCYESEKAKAEKETRKMGYIPIDFVFIDNDYCISYLIPKGHFTCAPKVKIQWAASSFTTTFARMVRII
jgi:hypothetical protein